MSSDELELDLDEVDEEKEEEKVGVGSPIRNWRVSTISLPNRPLQDSNDPNSDPIPLSNPQIFSFNDKLFLMGGNGLKECYVGEKESEEKDDIKWKQFSVLPYSMDENSACQGIVLTKINETHVFYSFWDGKIYFLEILEENVKENLKWEEIELSVEIPNYQNARAPRMCASKNLIFITAGKKFDVFDGEKREYTAQFNTLKPLASMSQHGFVLLPISSKNTPMKKEKEGDFYEFLLWDDHVFLTLTWQRGLEPVVHYPSKVDEMITPQGSRDFTYFSEFFPFPLFLSFCLRCDVM